MADLINIDTKEAGKKLQILNRNFMLVVVITFAVSIAYLYHQQQTLSGELVHYLMNDVQATTKIIEQNNKLIEATNKLIEKNTDAIENFSESKKKLIERKKDSVYPLYYFNDLLKNTDYAIN